MQFWRCRKCPPRHQRAAGAAPGREVEFPEVRCYGKHLLLEMSAENAALGGVTLPAGQSVYRFRLNEEDARVRGEAAFRPGTVWTVGAIVEVRLPAAAVAPGAPVSAASAPWVPTSAPWLPVRIVSFEKCNHKMGAAPWISRPVNCFVLLLTRDGSHGLDLSMLTHLFLADQCEAPEARSFCWLLLAAAGFYWLLLALKARSAAPRPPRMMSLLTRHPAL